MRRGGTRVMAPALGRVGVGPLEVVEPGRILDVPELGVGVGPPGGPGDGDQECGQQAAKATQALTRKGLEGTAINHAAIISEGVLVYMGYWSGARG